MRQSHLPTLLFAALAMVCAQPAISQCQYEVTAVIEGPPCPWGPAPAIGTAMNEVGAVVGWWQDCAQPTNEHAFVWTPDGGLETLPMPDDVTSMVANDINDNGTIVGTWTREDVGTRGFVYDQKTEEYAELPPVKPDGPISTAKAINNANQVVGKRSLTSENFPRTAYMWTEADGFNDLGMLGKFSTFATDINEDGFICGSTGFLESSNAFIWHDDELIMLGPVPPDGAGSAKALNDTEMIAGSGTFVNEDGTLTPWPAKWVTGEWLLLPILPSCNMMGGGALRINNVDQIVGSCSESSNQTRPLLWQYGSLYEIENLVSSDDFSFDYPTAINNSGRILLQGANRGNDLVAIIIKPINQPQTDLTHDCVTGVNDLLVLLDEWGKGTSADFDRSGAVDVKDLILLLRNWDL